MRTHINLIKNKYLTMDQRTKRTVNNAIYSFFFKSVGIISNLLLVPVMLSILDSNRYGIWLTIASIISWFNFFDLGLGHGLRNKFAEKMADGDYYKTKSIISNTYFLVSVISILFFLISMIAIPLINWNKALNTRVVHQDEIRTVMIIVTVCFSFNLISKLISSILLADQKAAISDLISQGSLLITLVAVFGLSGVLRGSLTRVALLTGGIPIFFNLLASIILFGGKFRKLRPSIKLIDCRKWKGLFSLSSKFFITQLASVVLFSSANFIITQVSGPEDVTKYNIALRYLSVPLFLFGIILTPYWSAITDAFARKDFGWLRYSRRKLLIISGILSGLTIVMLLFSRVVYKIWIGNKIEISFGLSFLIAVNIIIRLFVAPYSTFLNGFGKLNMGILTIIVEVLLYVPLAIWWGRNFGASGVVLALIACYAISVYVGPKQVSLIIKGKAKGIWGK